MATNGTTSAAQARERERQRRAKAREQAQAKRRRLAARAQKMRDQGYMLREVAEALGQSTSTISAMTRRTSEPPPDAVDATVICDWVDAHSAQDVGGPRLVNGRPLNENETRALYRYREEGGRAEFAAVESILCRRGVRFDELVEWAAPQSVWARGEAPEWFDDASDSRLLEDLDSTAVTSKQLEEIAKDLDGDLEAMSDDEREALIKAINAERAAWLREGKAAAVKAGLLTADSRRRWGRAVGRPRRSRTKAVAKKNSRSRKRMRRTRQAKDEAAGPRHRRRHRKRQALRR